MVFAPDEALHAVLARKASKDALAASVCDRKGPRLPRHGPGACHTHPELGNHRSTAGMVQFRKLAILGYSQEEVQKRVSAIGPRPPVQLSRELTA